MSRLFAILCILCSPPLFAQKVPFAPTISEQLRSTFTLVGSGARAAGMGGAFTAVADDATAASFNPAGLAQLTVPEASVVFDRITLKDRYLDFVLFTPDEPPVSLTDSAVEFDHSDLNFLSITLPFRLGNRGWAAQFSTQKVVDLVYHGDRRFSELDSMMNPVADIRQKSDQTGGIRIYSGSVALSATRRMLLGVTVNRWQGDWKIDVLNAETQLENPEESEFLTYSQSNSLEGWNFDAGMLLRYKYANVGIRYRSPFSADYRLVARVNTNINEDVQPLPNLRTKLEWPSTFNAGFAIKTSDRLTFAVDYGRTDWSKMVFNTLGKEGEVNFFDLRARDLTLAKVAHDWRFGAEFVFLPGSVVLPIRAGWIHEPQPGLDADSGNRLISRGYSVGAGMKIQWFAVDVAYQRRTSNIPITLFEPDDLVIGDPTNPSRGKLDRMENRFFVSMILQVPKNTFLDRLFRAIFVG